jgi:hypothetical protein
MDFLEQAQETLDNTMDLEPNHIPQQTPADVAEPEHDMPQEAIQAMGQVADNTYPTTNHGTPLTHLPQQGTLHLPRTTDLRRTRATSHLQPAAREGKMKGQTTTMKQYHNTVDNGTTKRTKLLQSSITTFVKRYHSEPLPTAPPRNLYHKKSYPKRHMHPDSTTQGLDMFTASPTKGNIGYQNIPDITQSMLWDHTTALCTPPLSEIDWSDEEALIDQFTDSDEELPMDHMKEPENDPSLHSKTPPLSPPPATTLTVRGDGKILRKCRRFAVASQDVANYKVS